MDVVLVGLPGSGKSVVGRRLANRHGASLRRPRRADRGGRRPHRSRRSSPRTARPAFRALERAAIADLGPADPAPDVRRVISTGGGAVVDPRNRWALYRGRTHGLARRPAGGPRPAPAPLAARPAAGHRPRPDRDDARPRRPARAVLRAPPTSTSRASPRSTASSTRSRRGCRAAGSCRGGRRSCAPRRRSGGSCSATGSRSTRSAAELDAMRAPARHPRQRAGRLGGRRRAARDRSARTRPRGRPRPAARRARRPSDSTSSRRRRASWPASASSGRSRWWRSVAARSATRPASWPRSTCAASGSSRSRPRWSPRSIRRSAARPGVDLPEGKNLVGAFHQPSAVIIDIAMLRTLPERQLRAALGEAVKMAALGDERLFELLEARRAGDRRAATTAAFASGAVAELVERAGWAKVEVVVADERERGAPAAGSRSTSGTRSGTPSRPPAGYGGLLHGEAVAYGLRAACPDRRRGGRHAAGAGGADRRPARCARAGDRAAPLPARRRSWTTSRRTRSTPAGRLRWVLPTADGVVDPRRHRPGARRAGRRRPPGRPEREPAMTTVLVLQGPNLNLVGTREPEIYGYETLDEIHAGIAARAAELGLDVAFFQSNHEGALIDRLHQRDFDVAIVNAGGPDPHEHRPARRAARGPAAVHRGPPVRPVEARAVPPGQLPPRRRARVDRRPGGARLPPGARVDRPAVR